MAGRRIPLTVDARSLLIDGSDERLRQLVYDLFTVSVRMQQVRDALARQMNVTGPQYTVLMAVGELQGDTGVPVNAVAQRLHVTGAHATIEIGKLAKKGILSKMTNPKDGRSVLVRLTARGLALIDRIAPLLRATNGRFFGELDRNRFLAAADIAERLVAGSQAALQWWAMHPEAGQVNGSQRPRATMAPAQGRIGSRKSHRLAPLPRTAGRHRDSEGRAD
jgi:DNA-binding MarR family transcriptional regulator